MRLVTICFRNYLYARQGTVGTFWQTCELARSDMLARLSKFMAR
jgi:hypothetical protein